MNIAWTRPPGGQPLADPAFPGGEALLAAVGLEAALGEPAPDARLLEVYYYPQRILQAVHGLPDGRVVTLEAAPSAGERAAPPDVRLFPADPGLPQLRAVVAALGAGCDLLAYLPGRRCALGTPAVVVKTGAAATLVLQHSRQRALWAAPGRAFRMAQPVRLGPGRGARTEVRVPGGRLEDELDPATVAGLATALGTALAGVHRLAPEGPLPDRGPAVLLARLTTKTVRTVHRALPGLADRAACLAGRLADAGLPDGSSTLVHGDFHTANLLFDDGEVVVLDLDEVGLGHREADLALLTSRLVLLALHRGPGTATARAALALADALPDAYASASGRRVDPAAYAWYLAASLLGRQVKTSIRHLAPDLPGLAVALVELGERVLARGRLDPAWVLTG